MGYGIFGGRIAVEWGFSGLGSVLGLTWTKIVNKFNSSSND